MATEGEGTGVATPSTTHTSNDARDLLHSEVTGKISVPVLNVSGGSVGSVDLDPADFGGKISKQLLHDVVLMYLANQRAGTHSTLRRGEVAGSSKKLFRQKGTGNARAGTKRTNKRRGGGTAKGPKPRDYEYHLPKRAVRAATRMALLSKFRDGEAIILNELTLNGPKTKDLIAMLKAIKVGKTTVQKGEQSVDQDVSLYNTTVLISTADYDLNIYKSGRNIPGVKVLPASELNVYTILKHKRLVLTQAAFDKLREIKLERRPEKAPKPVATKSADAKKLEALPRKKKKLALKKLKTAAASAAASK